IVAHHVDGGAVKRHTRLTQTLVFSVDVRHTHRQDRRPHELVAHRTLAWFRMVILQQREHRRLGWVHEHCDTYPYVLHAHHHVIGRQPLAHHVLHQPETQ